MLLSNKYGYSFGDCVSIMVVFVNNSIVAYSISDPGKRNTVYQKMLWGQKHKRLLLNMPGTSTDCSGPQTANQCQGSYKTYQVLEQGQSQGIMKNNLS